MNTPRAVVIDGKAIASKLRSHVAAQAKTLKAEGWQPSLMSISVGDVAAAEIYVRNQKKQAESAGVSLIAFLSGGYFA